MKTVLFLAGILLCGGNVSAKTETVNEYGKQTAYKVGSQVIFADIVLTYEGHRKIETPTTASPTVDTFTATDRKNKEKVEVEVRSGQLPPAPQSFFVAGKKYTLYIFKGPNGERLDQGHLMVEKNN